MEADPANNTVHAVASGSVTLVAYENITGNPPPHSSSWMMVGGGSLSNGGRFTTSVSGQLTISDLTTSDTGNYNNTLTNTVNGTDQSISRTVELTVLGE